MNPRIEELLYEEESSFLDFKKEQYPFDKANEIQKGEILKDILAFSNAWRRADAFILIGVEEIKGERNIIVGINEDLDDARLQQFVNSKTQRPITFEYRSITLEGKKVGVIRIPLQSRPIYLKKDYGRLKANVVYIRRGSSTAEAEPDEIANMGAASPETYQIRPQIQVEFAKNKGRIRLGSELEIDIVRLLTPPRKEIPKYEESRQHPITLSMSYPNRDFYRKLVDYYFWKHICRPFTFHIENISDVPALGLKIELSTQKSDDFGFLLESHIPYEPTQNYISSIGNIKTLSEQLKYKSDSKLTEASDKWLIVVEVPRLQPKSSYFSEENIFFYSLNDVSVKLEVSIYADNLSTPIKSDLLIKSKVQEKPGDLKTILKMHYEIVRKRHQNEE
jgi:hypothetical protein